MRCFLSKANCWTGNLVFVFFPICMKIVKFSAAANWPWNTKMLIVFSLEIQSWNSQGILYVPGIAGYKWVPARIGRFFNTKYCLYFTNGQLKTGTQSYAEPSRASIPWNSRLCFLCPDEKSSLLSFNAVN